MGFVQELIDARRRPVAITLDFSLRYDARSNQIYAFVEGTADKEYLEAELRRRKGDGTSARFFVCDGKSGVLTALEFVERSKPAANRTLFFVDSDFDSFIPISSCQSPRLFTTSFYSIENHMVSCEAVRIILCELAHIDPDDARVAIAAKQYAMLTRKFARFMRRYAAAAICARRDGISVNLNNVNLGKAFHFSDACELSERDCVAVELSKMSGLACGIIPVENIKIQMRALKIDEYKKWMRGKYELWIFIGFINRIWHALIGEPATGTRRIEKSFDLTESNIFRLLSGRVRYPHELLDYLDRAL